MSKILVVEPYKILQRAIAISLFPEHEVQITDHLPEMNALEQRSYDIVVVDAGALRERTTVGELDRCVQGWRIPTIWLEETISTVVPTRDKLVVLRKPILMNDLLSALAQCQEKRSTMSLARGSAEPSEKVRGKEGLANADLERHPKQEKARVIELVDVVEEGIVSARAGRLSRKKK
jgi:hypothetical protein